MRDTPRLFAFATGTCTTHANPSASGAFGVPWRADQPESQGHIMTTSTAKKRTITLTGRAPVTIREDRWPIIAKAHGNSNPTGAEQDPARHSQAVHRGELDIYHLIVRQHADGRTIVYAILDGAGAWTGTEDRRGGELLEPGADIATAILRVGVDVGIPRDVIRECIADLPAEDLDKDDDGGDSPPRHRT